jgi:hypothetical protein
MLVIALLGGIALGASVWGVTRSWGKRQHRRRFARRRIEPQSCVRVLNDDNELAEAVERAIAFERVGARASGARIKRYEHARPAAPVVPFDRGLDEDVTARGGDTLAHDLADGGIVERDTA